jgi:hypothetical protein
MNLSVSIDNSLSRIVSVSRARRTPTAKAKTIVSLVMRPTFAHGVGIPQGYLTVH